MKLKNILYNLTIIFFMATQLYAQNTNPVVSNVAFSISGTTVTVTYDVTDANQSTVTISMEVSSDAGASWGFNYGTANGDIGAGVSIGTGKIITWTYSGGYSESFKIRIIADDLVGDQIYYAGKIYNTVTIGSETWLKENLDVGIRINRGQIASNNGVIEKYCYDNEPNNCNTYGGLYQWDEAMQYITTADAQGICPNGWHIPNGAVLGNLRNYSNEGALLAIGQGIGTNTSGFSALLAGVLINETGFTALGIYTFFWSSWEYDSNTAYHIYLFYNRSESTLYIEKKEFGYSVRCVKN